MKRNHESTSNTKDSNPITAEPPLKKQNQIANNESNTSSPSIPKSQTKRPIELWRDLRASLNSKRAYHFPLWNFRDEISIFTHEIEYDHFCIIYFKLYPLLKQLYYIPMGISKYIAEYATGFFDKCDMCKRNVHIFYNNYTDKANFFVTNKYVKDKHPFINISCLCAECKKNPLCIRTRAVQSAAGSDIYFKMKRGTTMKKLMTTYAYRLNFPIQQFLFTFQTECNGKQEQVVLMNDMTPHDLVMKDNDIVNVSFIEENNNEKKPWTFNADIKWD